MNLVSRQERIGNHGPFIPVVVDHCHRCGGVTFGESCVACGEIHWTLATPEKHVVPAGRVAAAVSNRQQTGKTRPEIAARNQEIIVLRVGAGKSYKEVAEILGISEDIVSNTVHEWNRKRRIREGK